VAARPACNNPTSQAFLAGHGKGKGKAYLYSAFRETSTQGAQVWITQGCPCKLHHTCLYLANVRQMAPPERHTSDSARYSFIDPWQLIAHALTAYQV